MAMLTSWKSEQDTVLKKLISDISEVKLQNTKIQNSNLEIEKAIEYINKEYESMRTTIQKMEKERSDQRMYILDLEKKVNDLQYSSRAASIEIRNVPIGDTESMEDLTSIVLNTCSAIKSDINRNDLRDVYRLSGKKGEVRPIVAEFKTVYSKNRVIECSRKCNESAGC